MYFGRTRVQRTLSLFNQMVQIQTGPLQRHFQCSHNGTKLPPGIKSPTDSVMTHPSLSLNSCSLSRGAPGCRCPSAHLVRIHLRLPLVRVCVPVPTLAKVEPATPLTRRVISQEGRFRSTALRTLHAVQAPRDTSTAAMRRTSPARRGAVEW